jgi:hypothetical protein
MAKKKTTANKPKIKSEAKRSIVGVILIAIALLSFLSFL